MFDSPLLPLILAVILLWPARQRLLGTTLIAPWAWSMASLVFWMAVEIWVVQFSASASLGRYLAAVGTLCPMMAVMGAKRPQDRGWQWIVLSLWAILAIPVAQFLVFTRGQPFHVFAAWLLFLALLLALELLNYLPTRQAGSALLICASQVLLVGNSLGWQPLRNYGAVVAAWLLFLAIGLAWVIHRQSAPSPTPDPRLLTPTHQWLQFRNSFGAFWALRVLQRVNQTAEVQDWPVRLQWSGFCELPNRNDMPPTDEIDQCLQNLLRRFVTVSENSS